MEVKAVVRSLRGLREFEDVAIFWFGVLLMALHLPNT